MKPRLRWFACAAVGFSVVALAAPRAVAADPCPQGFWNEPVQVFTTAAAARLTAGKVKDGRICVHVKQPPASGPACGLYTTDLPSVFAGAHLLRMTGSGSLIRAGKICVATEQPGFTAFDPIDPNPAENTIVQQPYANHDGAPISTVYRTIENANATICLGQCMIRKRCRAYSFDTGTKKCELRLGSRTDPSFDARKRSGVKFPKTAVRPLQAPVASVQFSSYPGKQGQGTPVSTTTDGTFEACSKKCLLTGGCKAFNLTTVPGAVQCRLYSNPLTQQPSPQPAASYVYGVFHGGT